MSYVEAPKGKPIKFTGVRKANSSWPAIHECEIIDHEAKDYSEVKCPCGMLIHTYPEGAESIADNHEKHFNSLHKEPPF